MVLTEAVRMAEGNSSPINNILANNSIMTAAGITDNTTNSKLGSPTRTDQPKIPTAERPMLGGYEQSSTSSRNKQPIYTRDKRTKFTQRENKNQYSNKMPLSSDQKLIILRLIEENKTVLLGKFTNSITNDLKVRTWKGIVRKCRKEYGFDAVPAQKDWKYLRDTTWKNWKDTAKGKFDGNRDTGAEGGVEKSYSEIDLAVLNILGPDSAGIVGLPVREQWDEDLDIANSEHQPSNEDEIISDNDEDHRFSRTDPRRKSWPISSVASLRGGPAAKTPRIAAPLSTMSCSVTGQFGNVAMEDISRIQGGTSTQRSNCMDPSSSAMPVLGQSQFGIRDQSTDYQNSAKGADTKSKNTPDPTSSSGRASRMASEYEEEKLKLLRLQIRLAEVQIAYLETKTKLAGVETAYLETKTRKLGMEMAMMKDLDNNGGN